MIHRLILIKKLKSAFKKSGCLMYDVQGSCFSKYSFRLETNLPPLYRFNIIINWSEKTIELYELNHNWFKKGAFGAGIIIFDTKKLTDFNIQENTINNIQDYLQSYFLIHKLSN